MYFEFGSRFCRNVDGRETYNAKHNLIQRKPTLWKKFECKIWNLKKFSIPQMRRDIYVQFKKI